MTKMTHKEMTAHIRGRLKAQGIHARVKMNEACGTRYITIVTPTYEARWTSEELKAIAICADVNRLTSARKMPIDVRNIAMLTGTTQINFEFHG